MFVVLTDRSESWWKETLKLSRNSLIPHNDDKLSPLATGSHIVLEVDPSHISTITNCAVKIPAPEKIVENYAKRQIPRFRYVFVMVRFTKSLCLLCVK